MKKNKADASTTEHQNAKASHFERLKNSLCEGTSLICKDTRKEAQTVRFWIELAGLVGLFVYIIINFCMWQDVGENFKTDERAWVAPFDVSSEPSEIDNTKTIFKVLFKNTGKTPAVGVHAFINRVDSLEKVPSSDPENINPEANMLLAPNAVGNTSTADIPITAEDVENIRRGTLRVYVYGTIWYRDIFKCARWTQFCYRVGQNVKSFGSCPAHNGCDNCQE